MQRRGLGRAGEGHHVERLQLVQQPAELPQTTDSAPAAGCRLATSCTMRW
jgi:hypothetical protein